MQLRIDHLLHRLKHEAELILEQIDCDPLLLKREVNDLVLANATKELFSPQEEHHLFAKGIVYRRNPFRLVSLPLLKIYNLGERNVTVNDLVDLTMEGARVAFLQKLDGSMIQRFQHEGQIYFSTRGMLEGIELEPLNREKHFDYLQTARQIATKQFSRLLEIRPEWEGLTLIMELIHPEARVITDYGLREDLVLTAIFDRNEMRYWTFQEVTAFARSHQLNVTDTYNLQSESIHKQIEEMLRSIQGTDQEGCVINFETDRVLYRVKVKSPDYMRLLKLMMNCSYANTVEMLRAFPTFPSWSDFEVILKSQGSENVPEELLSLYREHYEMYSAYRDRCELIRKVFQKRAETIFHQLPDGDERNRRRLFASAIQCESFKPLLFSAYDQKLTLQKVEAILDTPESATEALKQLN